MMKNEARNLRASPNLSARLPANSEDEPILQAVGGSDMRSLSIRLGYGMKQACSG
jgi:hypothetical protein